MADDARAPSPPLPPDPVQATATSTAPRVQPFQEQYIANPLSQTPAQPEPKRANPSRSRAASSARPVIHQPQPIRDAVDKAFDQSIDQSSITAHLDPAFIAQVTEAVVKNLAQANLSGATPQPSTQYPPAPPPATQPMPQSPALSSTASIPSRYTPPSPNRERTRSDAGGYGIDSPYLAPSDAGTSFGKDGRDSILSLSSSRYGDSIKSSPPSQDVAENMQPNRLATDRGDPAYDNKRATLHSSAPDSRFTSAPLRRDSQGSSGSNGTSTSRSRPHKLSNATDDGERTTLEKIWQPLFDKTDTPTPRLGQFLRGLAKHIIEDYEPKHSLVITPAKALRFFDETKVRKELYPWKTIFGGSVTCPSISVMFRRLPCQHHLVQTANHEVPNVPGLTPSGFESFMTYLIQAHPDTEFERLAKAVMHMPISNADDPKERFPKELSRRLLPAQPNSQAEQRIIASMAHEPLIRLKNSTAMPPPPPPPASAPPPSVSVPQQQSGLPERERMPYSRSSHSNAVDDDDLGPPPLPLERERKPYTAREGKGKTYESDGDRDDRDRLSTSQYRPESSTPGRPVRQKSTGPQGSYPNNGPSDPRSIPPTSRQSGPPPSLANYSKSFSGRRSPPLGSSFSRGDSANVSDVPASQYTSNSHPAARIGTHMDDDVPPPRRFPVRRPTHSSTGPPPSVVDDDPHGRPIPSRSNPGPPPTGYDSGYGSVGAQPGLAGAPAFFRPSPTSRFDDRRKSAYANGSGSGGTDGWGSFADGGYPPQHGNSSTVGH